MIDVVFAYEEADVGVSVPAVPRVGDRVLRDDGRSNEYVVTLVQWYWEGPDFTDGPAIYVFLDPVRGGQG
jgi:hypothetical protein